MTPSTCSTGVTWPSGPRHRRGDVATLNVVGPGGYFGELALVSEERVRHSTVIALDAVETLALHRHQFDDAPHGPSECERDPGGGPHAVRSVACPGA